MENLQMSPKNLLPYYWHNRGDRTVHDHGLVEILRMFQSSRIQPWKIKWSIKWSAEHWAGIRNWKSRLHVSMASVISINHTLLSLVLAEPWWMKGSIMAKHKAPEPRERKKRWRSKSDREQKISPEALRISCACFDSQRAKKVKPQFTQNHPEERWQPLCDNRYLLQTLDMPFRWDYGQPSRGMMWKTWTFFSIS